MALIDVEGLVATHDPTIVKENGIYYRFQTAEGLAFFSSTDLKRWNIAGKVFDKNPEWTQKDVPGSTSFWAPEIVYRDGWWRVYYSVSTFGKNRSAIGFARNRTLDVNSPDYKWEDLGPIIESDSSCNYNCIDPAVCSDFNGKDWFLFGSFWGGLMMAPMNKDGFLEDGCKLKNIASRQLDPNPVEGGFLFRHGKYFYLFASHDFCCRGTASSYHIVVGRSENIEGPYYDEIGVDMMEGGGTLIRNGLAYPRWAGPGHNSVFEDDNGKIYLVYHAYDRTDEGRPKLMIEEITFDEDGWIEFA